MNKGGGTLEQNLAKAEEHLSALRKLCTSICVERDDLEKAIAEYRRRAAAAR